MKRLEWTTVLKTPNEVLPLQINPRKISEAKMAKLIDSINKFGFVTLAELDFDDTLLSGHQRIKALQAIGKGDVPLEFRKANRKLTDKEVKEWNLMANSHFGEFDNEILEEFFSDLDFEGLGLDFPQFDIEDSINVDNFKEDFTLKDGDRQPFQQMTFTLADEQAEFLKNAISDIKKTDEYKYMETFGNENGNGNCLYLIITQWAQQKI